jgi:hypothetical protein
VAVPLLTYASENWTINRSGKRETESPEMRFLHPVAGYTLLDQKLKYRHTFRIKYIKFN